MLLILELQESELVTMTTTKKSFFINSFFYVEGKKVEYVVGMKQLTVTSSVALFNIV